MFARSYSLQIAKLDYANDLLLEAEGGDGATRALLASYGRTPGATPLRTPARTPGGTGTGNDQFVCKEFVDF